MNTPVPTLLLIADFIGMLSAPAYAACTGFYDEPERCVEEYDDGPVEALVFYGTALVILEPDAPDVPRPSSASALAWKLKMHGRTLLELIGLQHRAVRAEPLFSV